MAAWRLDQALHHRPGPPAEARDGMNRDFVEILSELSAADAELLIVGAHVLAAHGLPRATGDIDIGYGPRPTMLTACCGRWRASERRFDLTRDDLTRSDTVFQIGVPPARVDVLSGISGVAFDDAWARRTVVTIDGVDLPVISREDFIANTRAAGRPKDLLDLALLAEVDLP